MDSLLDLLSGHGQAILDLDSRTVLYLLVAVVVGVILGWFFRAMLGKRALQKVDSQWQDQLDQAIRLKEDVNEESLEAQEAIVQAHTQAAAKIQKEMDSLRGKVDTLSKGSHVLGDERDELKDKLLKCMALANEAKQHIDQQDVNFTKASVFYKGQLQNAFEQRTTLERRLERDKSENESLRNLLMSTKAEHESVSNLLTTAQARLKDMEELEQRSIALEAENAELRQEVRNADPSMAPEPPAIGLDAPQGEPDNLQDIVGIGKVFEATLHDLGVYHFRQIAAFGPAEIARINAEMKEFEGRIEHDDWIGQARERLLREFDDSED